jgi:hypothetical protein
MREQLLVAVAAVAAVDGAKTMSQLQKGLIRHFLLVVAVAVAQVLLLGQVVLVAVAEMVTMALRQIQAVQVHQLQAALAELQPLRQYQSLVPAALVALGEQPVLQDNRGSQAIVLLKREEPLGFM